MIEKIIFFGFWGIVLLFGLIAVYNSIKKDD